MGNEEKIDVQVVAEDAQWENCLDFKMKFCTPFQKMMNAWCQHHSLSLQAVKFELDGREVQPEESPESFHWSPERGTLIIQASPRNTDSPPSQSGLKAETAVTSKQLRPAAAATG